MKRVPRFHMSLDPTQGTKQNPLKKYTTKTYFGCFLGPILFHVKTLQRSMVGPVCHRLSSACERAGEFHWEFVCLCVSFFSNSSSNEESKEKYLEGLRLSVGWNNGSIVTVEIH